MVYILLLILVIVGILLYDIAGNSKNKGAYFYSIFIIASLITGLSYRLGGDVIHYNMEYYEYSSLFEVEGLYYFFSFHDRMPLWVLVNTVFRTLSCDFWVFHLFQVMIVNISVATVLARYANCNYCSILLYAILAFPLFNYEILRESLAVAIFLFSIRLFIEFRPLRYYCAAFIALGFHLSATILFVLPLIKLLPKGGKGVMVMLTICFSIIFFADIFTEKIMFLLNIEMFSAKAMGYFSNERYGTSIFSYSFLINLCFYVLIPYAIYLKYLKENDETKTSIFYLVAAYTVIYCCTLVIPIFYRINNYFVVFFIAYIASTTTMKYPKLFHWKRMTRCLTYGVIIMFILLKINNVYLAPVGLTSFPSYRRYIPYSSIFTKEIDKDREKFYY